MTLGTRAKRRRLELGLQAKFVAKELGVSLSTYSDWENGRQIRGEHHFVKLAEILHMSISELFTGKRSPDVEEQLQVIEQVLQRIRQSL